VDLRLGQAIGDRIVLEIELLAKTSGEKEAREKEE